MHCVNIVWQVGISDSIEADNFVKKSQWYFNNHNVNQIFRNRLHQSNNICCIKRKADQGKRERERGDAGDNSALTDMKLDVYFLSFPLQNRRERENKTKYL